LLFCNSSNINDLQVPINKLENTKNKTIDYNIKVQQQEEIQEIEEHQQ